MPKILISIQEAADISKKSIQTIRRAIKTKKLKVKKSKTPQGFNYMVDKDSLCEFYGIKLENEYAREHSTKEKISFKIKSETMPVEIEDFKSFVQTLKTVISQHNEERQNFLRLVNTLQEKIFVLENQVNLLKAPQKSWFQFWK